ncbi:DUF547 domain-containing protein [Alteromonas gilva]|uniref:DUF547 domain-containing protein n=1 Tax=Alteromonas gilva TaxID=2987522 RepID=A0ABT5L7S4_9ALTE|nr:DUF547 domain-containing protein [Alteromonas gilva]MDC8832479.1 DUF547 domain-containing protein [Alteromonas gilva]
MFSKNKAVKILITGLVCSVAMNVAATSSEPKAHVHFNQHAERATQSLDYSVLNQLLHAGVLNMGRSTRKYADKATPLTGTRMRQPIDGATENEANRFFYENLAQEQVKILKLRKELEAIPTVTPMKLLTKEQQLAYWLNLYNVTVINEIAKLYPIESFRDLLEDENSFFHQKLLNVEGVELSLNDIHFDIIPALYPDEPLVIYGLYQGYKGSPNIRKKAYTGKNVFKNLQDNAQEFINSNRGTQFNGSSDTVRVSKYYQRNAMFFPNFEEDLKSHLLVYADPYTKSNISQDDTVVANVRNYRIADIYGTYRNHEGSVSTDPRAYKGGKSYAQVLKLRELMRVRAINFGGEGRVTVTDLDSAEEESN